MLKVELLEAELGVGVERLRVGVDAAAVVEMMAFEQMTESYKVVQ